MHMHSECYLLALYCLQVSEVNREGYPRPFFADGCHGNTKMLMPAKFHFNAFYGLQFWEVKNSFLVKKCPRPFFVHGCHGNAEIHIHTKFHFHALHGLQV